MWTRDTHPYTGAIKEWSKLVCIVLRRKEKEGDKTGIEMTILTVHSREIRAQIIHRCVVESWLARCYLY